MKRSKAGNLLCAVLALIIFTTTIMGYLPDGTLTAYAEDMVSVSDNDVNDVNETASSDFEWGSSKKACKITTAITGYLAKENVVSIPKKCTLIYDKAFAAGKRKNNSDITTLKFKEGSECTDIGNNAFDGTTTYQSSGYSLLSTVDFSNSKVSTIGDYAFYNCMKLSSITWPNAGTIKIIGAHSFENNGSLTAINLPATVTTIGEFAFSGNDSLRSAVTYGNIGKFAFAYDYALENVVVNGNIDEGAFIEDKNIKEAKINGTTIGDYAFFGNSKLEVVDFSGSTALKTIGKSAFGSCNLKGIIIPGTVTLIDDDAFAQSNLSDITFGNQSDLIIGQRAFFENNLKNAMLPDSCVSLGESAFEGNPINSAVIGARLDVIETNGFASDNTLNTVYVNGSPSNVSELGIFANSNLQQIVFKENVTKIADNLFCYSHFNDVAELIIPENIQVIGKNAFKGITGLKCMRLPDNISDINAGAFDQMESDFYLLVKENSKTHKSLEKYLKNDNQKVAYKLIKDENDESIINPETGKEDNDPVKVEEFGIKLKYNGEAVVIGCDTEGIKTNISQPGTYTLREDRFLKKTDGSTNNITYEFNVKEGFQIESVYIDSVNKGNISTYSFSDDYNHEVIINLKDEPSLFDPMQTDKDCTVDIFFHPECVNVNGPDSVHTFGKTDAYGFYRYYFEGQEKKDFYFQAKNNADITDVIVDGLSQGSIKSFSFDDGESHIIIIQSEGKEKIPEDVAINEDKDILSPSAREYDDDGNPIDKTRAMYSIVYNLAGGTNSPYNFGFYYEGSVFYFRNPVKPGCVFDGWYSGNTKVVSTKGCTTNLKLTARWKTIDYTITYELNGGQFKKPSKVVTSYNLTKTVKLQKPVKPGYTFIGWFYGDAKIKKLKKGDSIKGAITLVAKWTPNTYTIIYNANKGAGKMSKTTNCIYNQAFSLPSCTFSKKGKSFAGWNTKKDGTGRAFADGETVMSLKKKGKIKLYAQWK